MFQSILIPADLVGMLDHLAACFRGAQEAGVREAHLVHVFLQGRDRVTEFVTGSVAHGVARRATTPVLRVPARPHAES